MTTTIDCIFASDAGLIDRVECSAGVFRPQFTVCATCKSRLPGNTVVLDVVAKPVKAWREAICSACESKPGCYLWNGMARCERAKYLHGTKGDCPDGKWSNKAVPEVGKRIVEEELELVGADGNGQQDQHGGDANHKGHDEREPLEFGLHG